MRKRVILKNFLDLLNKKSKYFFFLSLFFGIFNAFGELIFVYSFTLLLDPNLTLLNEFQDGFDPIKKIIFLIFLIISSILVRFIFLLIMPVLASFVGNQLSKKVFSRILYYDFDQFLKNDTSEYIATLTLHSSRLIGGFIVPINNLISSFLTTILILFFIGQKNILLSLFGILAVSIFYFIIILSTKKFLNQLRIRRQTDVFEINSILNEAFNNFQQVFTYSKQELYINQFSKFNQRLQKDNMLVNVVGNMPKILFEGILSLVFILLISKSNNPKEGLFIFIPYLIAAYRILPNVNMIFSSWTTLSSNFGSVEVIIKFAKLDFKDSITNSKDKITFQLNKNNDNFLIAENISFKFPNRDDFLFKESNFCLNLGENLRINGKSGKGKSTLLTIIAGLRNPTKGRIIINSNKPQNISEGLIGYVDQYPKLFKGDLYENIKVNLNEKLNKDQEDFIELMIEKLSIMHLTKYKNLGDQGSKISGGERQRIAIARCLARKDKLLLFDEVSSSLDEKTLEDLQSFLLDLPWKKSIIFTSHNEKFHLNCKKELQLIQKRWIINKLD